MSQGYEPEDISLSDNVRLLCVLGRVLPHHRHRTISNAHAASITRVLISKQQRGKRKAIKEKARDVISSQRQSPFCKESLGRKTADTGVSSRNRFYFLFSILNGRLKISFWLEKNGKWVRAGTVEEGEGDLILECRIASRTHC